MLPFFGGNDCRNLSASTENEHSCKNIMKFYGLFLPIKRSLSHDNVKATAIFFRDQYQKSMSIPPSIGLFMSAMCYSTSSIRI